MGRALIYFCACGDEFEVDGLDQRFAWESHVEICEARDG